jgi:hypothetical protein
MYTTITTINFLFFSLSLMYKGLDYCVTPHFPIHSLRLVVFVDAAVVLLNQTRRLLQWRLLLFLISRRR